MKTIITISLFFLSLGASGQKSDIDSLILQNSKLRSRVDSLRKLLRRCSDFLLFDNPEWAEKTYYRNCKWSGTYVVINNDSTFLYVHNGEGIDISQKGMWQLNDNILILKGINKLFAAFQKKISISDKKNYITRNLFVKTFLFKSDILVEIE